MVSAVGGGGVGGGVVVVVAAGELSPPAKPATTASRPCFPCTAPIQAPRSPGFLTVADIASRAASPGQAMITSSQVVPRVGSPK